MKKAKARELLLKRRAEARMEAESNRYRSYTYDMFMQSTGRELKEMERFGTWVDSAQRDGVYGFELENTGANEPQKTIIDETARPSQVLNFGSYGYLGLNTHPQVLDAAKDAIDRYGLGATSAPVMCGTFSIHRQFEQSLVDFFGLPDRAVSLFTSGYAVNVGAIQAFMNKGGAVVLDHEAHMSILEGARTSGAELHYFRHNDMEHLEQVLAKVCEPDRRVLVCTEGVYSSDGIYGKLDQIVALAKRYGAYTMVDEAHSVLVAGENGRGVAEELGVLQDIDLYIMTFSKGFSGIGGAVLCRKEIARYINWYAKCRMFSCALEPGVTAGMMKVLELASGSEGEQRRRQIRENATLLRAELDGVVDICDTQSWIVPVVYGSELKTLDVHSGLHAAGLDTGVLQFPAVPKDRSRFRLFATAAHSLEHCRQAADIVKRVATQHGFLSDQVVREAA